MILKGLGGEWQCLAGRADGDLPNGADEKVRAQGGAKGRFYASKSFTIGSGYKKMVQTK